MEHDTPCYPPEIEARIRENERLYREAAEPVLRELRLIGVDVENFDELAPGRKDFASAVPVLAKWLPLVQYDALKESIARLLGKPQARGLSEKALITEFQRLPSEGLWEHVKWAIGDSLYELASPAIADEMIALALDQSHGKARQMVVYGLGRVRTQRAFEALIHLLEEDEWIKGYAIMGLGALGDPRAIPLIEPLTMDKMPFIRGEAKRALSRICKRSTRG